MLAIVPGMSHATARLESVPMAAMWTTIMGPGIKETGAVQDAKWVSIQCSN